MNMIAVIAILLVFVVLLYVIRRLTVQHRKFSTRVFTALGLGVVFGAIIQLLFGADSETTLTSIDWINIVGNGYVHFLQMLIIPLIFVSIFGAFTKIEQTKNLGKISGSVLATLIGTTGIAAFIGWAAVVLFGLAGAEFSQGAAETARIEALQVSQEQVADLTLPQQIVSFVPTNIFEDLAGLRSTSTIAVVVFTTLVGLAYLGLKRKQPEQAERIRTALDTLHVLVMRIVTIVLRMTPYGILALMTKMMATSSLEALINLGVFVIATIVAIAAVHLMHSIILIFNKVNPVQYYKKAFPVLSFAFTSRSSAASLPLNVKTQTEALGVDQASANFAASFGVTIGQNGCAGIYPAMLATMVAPTMGIDVTSIGFVLMLMAVVAISSFGVAGVGGGATFAALIVLGALNLPITIAGLLISVEPVIDMFRTMTNVNDSMVAGVVSSRVIGEFDESVLNNQGAVVDVEEV